MRCLVTGASGFLGHHLVAALTGAGAEVIALSRGEPQRAGSGLHWRMVDVERPDAVEEVFANDRPDVVFHLASLVTGNRSLDMVGPTFSANLGAAVNVLTAATRAECRRVVLAGSMEEPEPAEAASSPYAAAKGAASLYARFFRTAYDTPVVTARLFMIYGPGQRDTAKVVPASILAALDGRRPPISSGTRPVDWLYVTDAVAGLLALASAPGIEGATLDVGSGELVTVREVVEKICRRTGVDGPEVGVFPDRPGETVRRADPAATFRATGWVPRVGLDEGLEQTIAWYRTRRASGGG
jgi:nucleoside-diphosphate-sugar epimerase